jgi:pimeloyl-ACP methyl ester carboxylesterase
MTPLRGHDLERPELMISFRVAGSAAIPTVFPHGATLGHRDWIPRPDALRHRFRVVARDRRAAPLTGCGPSQHVRRRRRVITDIEYQESS